MYPFLDLHFIKIPMYGLCIAIGIVVAGVLSYLFCKKYKKDFNDFIIVISVLVFFGFIGAKLLYLLVSYPFKDLPKVVWNMLFNSKDKSMGSGFVFYGGVILGVPAFFLANKIAKCKNSTFLPEIAIDLPLIHGFGRIGCFCGGCCWGIPYEGPLALHYHNPITPVPADVGIFPVQLLEAFLEITFAVILIIRYSKNKPVKLIYYFTYYSIIRFALEYLRFDEARKFFWIFSTSQWISIMLFLGCITYIVVSTVILKKKGVSPEISAKSESAEAAEKTEN